MELYKLIGIGILSVILAFFVFVVFTLIEIFFEQFKKKSYTTNHFKKDYL
jgi:hypothetical protein